MEYQKSKKISAVTSVFNGSAYLQGFLDNVACQTALDKLDLVIVHNDPSQKEIEMLEDFKLKYPGVLNHIVVARESLAVSTNRAIRASVGDYVCIWNVDDLRTSDSLEIMSETLDHNPSVNFTYGDFIIVSKWQERKGKNAFCPEFNKTDFIRSMYSGPFYMWRKNICEKIGYWDEQFKSGADFDFAARLAVENEGKKTPGLLGYYLDEGLGLSTGKTPWQPIERTVIELRFRTFFKLDFWYYRRAKLYNINSIMLNGKWHSLDEYMPNRKKYAQSGWWLAFAVVRYPFWLGLRFFKFVLKKLKI